MMTDNRIVYAELFGQQHPMCLTVAADAQITAESTARTALSTC